MRESALSNSFYQLVMFLICVSDHTWCLVAPLASTGCQKSCCSTGRHGKAQVLTFGWSAGRPSCRWNGHRSSGLHTSTWSPPPAPVQPVDFWIFLKLIILVFFCNSFSIVWKCSRMLLLQIFFVWFFLLTTRGWLVCKTLLYLLFWCLKLMLKLECCSYWDWNWYSST